MKRILQSVYIRSLCYILVVALLLTVTPIAMMTPANAQLAPTYTVGVLDFTNESGIQMGTPARLATDAVVLELSKSNRYDVGITRTQLDNEMKKLDLRYPMTRVDIVKLADSLNADAMLEGFIKSISFAGVGTNRTATVTLIIQMIEKKSGEVINGAVQVGTSFARVGYTPDDQTLITEAINTASFKAVRQIVDYVIPEATIHMNLGTDTVILNKGSRDNIRPGMRMIVYRNANTGKDIVGYIEVKDVKPTDSTAKITKAFRGVQPEDKVTAIYDMPVIVAKGIKEDMPSSSAPSSSKTTSGKMAGIGKLVVGLLIVGGLAAMFKGGRGSENPVQLSSSNTILKWDPTKYGHGKNVVEYQIIRDEFLDSTAPVRVISDPGAIDAGKTDIRTLYNTLADTTVTYTSMASNPSLAITSATNTVPAEVYGTQHSYQIRVIYKTFVGGEIAGTIKYYMTNASNVIRATAIEPVKAVDIISPAYDSSSVAPEIQIADLRDGTINFQWSRKDGANAYYIVVEAVTPGITGKFDSKTYGLIMEQGPVVELPANIRTALADFLTRSSITSDTVLKWVVYGRNTSDTSSAYTMGEEARFRVGDTPPPQP